MKLRIVICDDEASQRLLLKKSVTKILDDYFVDYELVEYGSGEELLNHYHKVDLLFLDIQMGKLSGMDVARKIRKVDTNVEIIFTAALAQYVFDAYEVRAYRYLVKPLDEEKLKKYVEQCINEYLLKHQMITIDSNKMTLHLPIGDILYAEVMRKEVTIHTTSRSYTIETSLKKIEKKLINYSFFRCHHSYLVNLNHIDEVRDKMIFIGDYQIPVSRTRYKTLRIRFLQLVGDSLC